MYLLSNTKPLSSLAIAKGVKSWEQLLVHVRHLPYGRNSDRADFSLVLSEGKGSCSSKHALIKLIADENDIPQVKLIMAMYKMHAINTPGIGTVLDDNQISYLPEAHCFLRISDKNQDFTSSRASFDRLKKDILLETEISPDQVVSYKPAFHKQYMRDWQKKEHSQRNFEELWEVREKCIEALGASLG